MLIHTGIRRFLLFSLLICVLGLGSGCVSDDDDGNDTSGQPTGQVSVDISDNQDLITAFVANFASLTGMWTNNLFGSTGDFSVQSAFDMATEIFTITVDVNGNVFGGTDPAPETFAINMSDFIDNGVATINIASATYGDITVTLRLQEDGSGSFEGTATNIPAGATNAQAMGSFSIIDGMISFQVDSMSFDFGGSTITITNTFS